MVKFKLSIDIDLSIGFPISIFIDWLRQECMDHQHMVGKKNPGCCREVAISGGSTVYTLSLPESNLAPIVTNLTLNYVDETLVCDHLNESYWAVLLCGTVYFVSI